MSIWSSLWTGTSGLQAHGEAISVVGDNIANVSTIGYKGSRAGFDDVVADVAANGQRLGQGVTMRGPEVSYVQGSLQQTGRPFDLAVRGRGFFITQGSHRGEDGYYYTRDGRFFLDNEGRLVNPEGLRVQGYMANPAGQIATAMTDLTMGGESPPSATANLTMTVNLDASGAVPPPWNPLNAGQTSNFATSMTVYDSIGGAHRVDVFFRKNGVGSWDWHALVDGSEITGGVKGTPVEIANGALTFTNTGALNTQVTNFSAANFVNAQPGQSIAFSFGDPIAGGGTGLAGSTQFAGASDITAISQDGFSAGMLVDVSVADDGTINGRFSNGQSRKMARLALAQFRSEQGLQRAGDQLFTATNASGEVLIGPAGSGGTGSVAGGSLETSNVDLGNELVTLIAYQRAFSANAKTVSTADEMLVELANLKR